MAWAVLSSGEDYRHQPHCSWRLLDGRGKDAALGKHRTLSNFPPPRRRRLLKVPPSLLLNDENDDLYTPAEMKAAERMLYDVYQKAGAQRNLNFSYYPGRHKLDKKMQADALNG